MTTKSNMMEGRKRILECLAECGAEQEPIILLDLQKQYFEHYGNYLNKEELRMFFCKGHIKQVLEQFMGADVDLTTNIQETGSLYIRMKRPLAEALAAPLPVLAKNRVPVAEPKPAPILVSLPLGGLPASKPLVPLNKSSKIVSAYSLSASKTKGNEKMAASSTINTPPLSQKVGAGNKYLDENEENGGLEYAPSEALYEPKSAKTINASNMSKQPVDAAGLYSESEDEKNEEEQLKEAAKELEDLEGEDEEDEDLNEWDEEVGDEEEEEDEEDDYGDEAFAQNDLLLKKFAAKMADKKKMEPLAASSTLQQGGPSIAISSRSNAERYQLRALKMKEERRATMQNAINEKKEEEDEEDTEFGLEEKQPIGQKEKKQPVVVTKMVRRLAQMPEGGIHSKAVGKAVGTKPMPKPPVAGKWAIPEYVATAEIMMSDSSEVDEEEEGRNGFSFAEATTEEMADSGESPEIGMENAGEKVKEVFGNNGNQENGGNANNLGVIQANMQSIGALYGNAPMPKAGVQQQQSAMPTTLPAAMPDEFKQQMLAVITIVMKLESVFKAHDLHAKFAAGCYAVEYSVHFPSVDALVQFVRQNCNYVKVQTFGGKNEVFLLETEASAELDRLFQKVGRSLQAAANK